MGVVFRVYDNEIFDLSGPIGQSTCLRSLSIGGKHSYLVSPEQSVPLLGLGLVPYLEQLLEEDWSQMRGSLLTCRSGSRVYLYSPFAHLVGVLLGLGPIQGRS